MPEPVDDDAQRSALIQALRHFHATGQAAALLPSAPVHPVALASVAEQLAAAPVWPIVLEVRPQGPAAHSLREVLSAALAAAQKGGREAAQLSIHFAAFVALVMRLAREAPGPTALGPVLEQASKALAAELKPADADARQLAGDLKALLGKVPPGTLFELTADAPLRLVTEVVRASREPLRAGFAAQLELARERLVDLLQLDELAQRGKSAESLAGALGPAGRYLDIGLLANTVGTQRAGEPLPAARRKHVQELLAALDKAPRPGAKVALVADAPPAGLAGADVHQDADPVAAAAKVFDAASKQAAELFRLVRLANLEADGRYDAATHDGALAALDWQGFTADELGFLQPVVVAVSASRLRGADAAALSALQRSGRPVMVVSLDAPGEPEAAAELASYHASLGLLGVAHRETFVVQAGLARPAVLLKNVARMARAHRPSLVVLVTTADGPAPLRPVRAEAALLGRVHPEFRFDPEAGAGWAQRFELGDGQAPDQKWTSRRLAYQGPAGELTMEVPLTFADAVALEPAYQRHYRVAPRAAWSDELVPLAEWVEQQDAPKRDGAASARKVPFIWVVDDAGRLQRAVVTRALALATWDRQRAWRLCQELAGFGALERAVADAKAKAEADARAKISTLELAHKAELDEMRKAGARESMMRLAAALTDLQAPKSAAPAKAKAKAPDEAAPAAAPAAGAAPAAAAPAAVVEEAWIDSALCTSCNDCIKINKLLFVYNAEKQAIIGDIGKGTYAELVKAAEKCPAKCIHPGKPRAGDATATPDLVARGARLS